MSESIFNVSKKNENFISNLFSIARKDFANIIEFIDFLIKNIESDQEFHQKFLIEINKIFKNLNFINYVTTSGLLLNNSIFSLLTKRVSHMILPQIENNQSLTSIANEVFYNTKNYKDFKLIPKDRWERFIKVLFKNSENTDKIKSNIKSQMIESITILMDRISGGFSESEMMRYRPAEQYNKLPFNPLSINIRNIIENPDAPFDLLAIRQSIQRSKAYLNDILTQKDEKGISLEITMKINRIIQELQRLNELVTIYNHLNTETLTTFYVSAIKSWPEYFAPKNWFSKQIRNTFYLITFIATYHNGKTGEKYITSTALDYLKMFQTAAGGGIIVAILCFIKLKIGMVDNSSPFFKAFFYSLNYAVGFVGIYLLHMTLATKQPAMTAARIAHSLKSSDDQNKINYKDFTLLFSRLSRSQFIAFIGNVVFGFAFASGIFLLFKDIFAYTFADTAHAHHYYDELAKMDWKIFWFSCIAGFFLFISGMISGLAINRQRYHNVPERIFHHPILVRFFGEKKRQKIASWYEKNYGGILGNTVFGFLMGSAFLVGEFLRLPFDIRHITFSAGNLAIGIAGMNYEGITINGLVIATISIFLIGVCNFMVSFILSLMLAMRSNNISLNKIWPMGYAIIKEFFKNPYKFFFPPIRFKRKNKESK